MKKLVTIFFTFTVVLSVWGQSDLTFYHMGAITPQSAMNNASFFPDAEFYFSVPGVSGVNVNVNTGFNYNHLMSPVEGTDSVQVDLEKVLSHLKEGDNLGLSGDVSLFQFGLRSGRKTFSLFSNVRYSVGVTYPVQFLNYFVHGNGNFIGERVEDKRIEGGGIAYTELGLGYTQDLTILEDRKLKVGGRFKYLHGLAYFRADESASLTMYTAPETYDLSVTFNNASFQSAGLNDIQGDDGASYIKGFGANKNIGFAVDLGAELEINEKLSGFVSINDLGFISWKQDIENYRLMNSQLTLNGFDSLDNIDIGMALEDSLDMWSERSTTTESFQTSVGTRMILGANCQVLRNGTVSGSVSRRGFAYRSSELAFGVGYTHQFGKILTLSTSIIKEQSRPMKVGGGLMARLGLFQIYGVFDDIVNPVRGATYAEGVGFRVGLNFVVGRTELAKRAQKERKKKEELSPFPPEYDIDYLTDDGDSDGGY